MRRPSSIAFTTLAILAPSCPSPLINQNGVNFNDQEVRAHGKKESLTNPETNLLNLLNIFKCLSCLKWLSQKKRAAQINVSGNTECRWRTIEGKRRNKTTDMQRWFTSYRPASTERRDTSRALSYSGKPFTDWDSTTSNGLMAPASLALCTPKKTNPKSSISSWQLVQKCLRFLLHYLQEKLL